ncbi:MAG: IclR family transcriptional regulator [Pseudomonadota bacterium]|jgi:DNA-binding IclR family transcriptional regulator
MPLTQAPDSTASSTKDGEKERAGIQSVEVGFALLDVLAQAPGPLMLRDLAAAAHMSAAKAHRYLVSFQRLGLVLQDSTSTRYELGPATLRLGLATLSRLDAVKMARERLPALIEATGHTTALAVWGNRGPTLVHWQETPLAMPVSLRLGDVMPLLSSATGRCFAAFIGQGGATDKARPMIEEELALARKLGRSDLPSTPAQVQAMVQETRAQGLGRVVNVLLPGISGLCAPVFDADGHLVLGVVSLGSSATLDTAWDGPIAQRLRQFAQQLSADLGWHAH